MTFVDWLLDQPGLLAAWPFDDSSGASTVADIGPNDLPLTKNSGGTLGESALVSGISGAGLVGGTAANAFSRSVASGSTLDSTAAFTLGAWVQGVATPSSGSPDSIGRSSASYAFRLLTSGAWRGVSGAPAPPSPAPNTLDLPPHTAQFTDLTFLAMTWSAETGAWIGMLNGAVSRVLHKPGSITAGAGNFNVGCLNGGSFRIAGLFLCGEALSPGAIREGYQEGLLAAAPVSFWTPSDDDAAATEARAGQANRLYDPARAVIVTPGGNRYDADEYGALQLHAGAWAWPASDDDEATVPVGAMRLIGELTEQWSNRSMTNDPTYYDGTEFHYAGSSGTFPRSTAGLVAAWAARHRFGRQRDGDDLERARRHGDWLLTQQDETGAFFASDGTPSTWFVLNHLASACLDAGDDLGAQRLADWTAALEEAGAFIDSTDERAFYINGNIELLAVLGLYRLGKLTGDQAWQDAAEAQWQRALYPATDGSVDSQRGAVSTSDPTICGLRNGATGARLADDDALMALDPITGTAYLSESNGSSTAYGLDWDYLGVQCTFAAELWLESRDDRHLQLLNVFVNKALERLNTTTWVYDASGGTRINNASIAWLTPCLEALIWTGARPDLAADPALHFTAKTLPDLMNATTISGHANENFWVGTGDWLATLLHAALADAAEPAVGNATPAIVQTVTGSTGGTAATSFTVTLDEPTTLGNTLILLYGNTAGATGSPPTITSDGDLASADWTKPDPPAGGLSLVSNTYTACAYVHGIPAGITELTVTTSTSRNQQAIVREVSALAYQAPTAAAEDLTNAANTTSPASAAGAVGAGDLVIGWVEHGSSPATGITGVSAGWTLGPEPAAASSVHLRDAVQLDSPGGTQQAVFSGLSSGVRYTGALLAFAPVEAGGDRTIGVSPSSLSFDWTV